MRVLLQGRSARSVETTPGGDQVQIDQTAAALRRAFGVEADTSTELEPDLSAYDLVHVFGLVRPQEAWVQTRNARGQGTPVVLSPVYCDMWDFDRRGRSGPAGWLARHTTRTVFEAGKAVGRGLVSREWSVGSTALAVRGFRRMQRDIVDAAAVFLPNSRSEWIRLLADIPVKRSAPVVVVPNGIDVDGLRAQLTADIPEHLQPFRGCVLSVARIEGRKNQLSLIRALGELPLTVVCAGRPAANQPYYVRAVRDAAADAAVAHVHLLGEVSPQDKIALMALARVHVLPSWMETTGLSSLEAAFCGCSLVVSPNGDTREYFDGHAEFCDPASVDSIRTATLQAMRRPPNEEFATMIAERFTWTEAARRTLDGYRLALALR
jgi:glycosyltransferase involved in cell wall biosynthesis